jgi:phosphoribosylformylglycinamidine (FGAM) synthase-like enzyme
VPPTVPVTVAVVASMLVRITSVQVTATWGCHAEAVPAKARTPTAAVAVAAMACRFMGVPLSL